MESINTLTLHSIQVVAFIYLFILTAHYYLKYSIIEDVYILSAVLDEHRLNIVFHIDSQSHSARDMFLIRNNVSEKLVLDKFPLFSRKLYVANAFLKQGEEVYITAEHEKTPLLSSHYGRPAIIIRPMKAYEESHEVVTCATPIHRYVSYENAITGIASSVAMGSFINVPMVEVNRELFDILRVFEKKSAIRIDPQPLIRDKIIRNNINLMAEAAQLHCLLMYRSKSKFLIFQDIDDVMLPIQNNDYFNEFAAMFQTNVIILNYNARIAMREEGKAFSLPSKLKNLKIITGNSSAIVLKTPIDLNNDDKIINNMIPEKLNNTFFNVDLINKVNQSFYNTIGIEHALRKVLGCSLSQEGNKCISGKCATSSSKYGSLHGLYSYNIHLSKFLRYDIVNCDEDGFNDDVDNIYSL